jgi:hypothetical protein
MHASIIIGVQHVDSALIEQNVLLQCCCSAAAVLLLPPVTPSTTLVLKNHQSINVLSA